jgi:ABC-2 type transport system permease protein
MELLLIGSHSLASATRELLKGLAVGLGITYVTAALLLVALGQSASIQVSVTASLFFATALCMPAAVCIGIGALVSQLASTRRRAKTYGTTLLIIFFALRSIGNIVPSLSWLKYCTPFGWTDKLHPITGSDAVWLLPLVALMMLAACLALFMARRRDLGDSIITDDGTAPARTALLGGPFGFGLRMNRGSLVAWCMAIAAISGLITAIAKTAADALTDSPSLTKALGAITGGSTGLAIAFIGFGGFFTALLLMLMATNSIGRIREDESKGYADNFLVGPISRARWLGSRIVLIVCSAVVLCIVANSICLLVARAQGIPVSSGAMLLGGLNYTGPALLVIGVGTLLFGIVPRLASPVLYAWVGWSFIVEMLGSVVVLPAYTYDTSLLRHISIVPATQPDWKLFAIICLCGTIAGVTGVLLFARRDLVGE